MLSHHIRDDDGKIVGLKNIIWPSDHVLGAEVAALVTAYVEARDALQDAQSAHSSAHSSQAMQQAERDDAARVVQIALDGGDHEKAASETPAVDALKRERLLTEAGVAVAKRRAGEVRPPLVEALNTPGVLEAMADRADSKAREAGDAYRQAIDALAAARSSFVSACNDRAHLVEMSGEKLTVATPRNDSVNARVNGSTIHSLSTALAGMKAEIDEALVDPEPLPLTESEASFLSGEEPRRKAVRAVKSARK